MRIHGRNFWNPCLLFLLVLTIIFISVPVSADFSEEEDYWGVSSLSIPDSFTYSYTGAATHKIPIAVPPGRGGIGPNLSLVYSSYTKNGWVGLGWNLDMGAIQRSMKRGVNYSANDFVAVNGGSSTELVPRDDWGTSYFGAKIEGAFAKYHYMGATAGWEFTTKEGTKYYYGTTSASRQDNAHGVFKWCLDRVEDTNGNYMTVSYSKDQGQIYPDRIDYTGNGSLSPTNYVKFYLESRTDAPPMYNTKTQVITAKRLKTIDIQTLDGRARAYKLTYTPSASTSQSLLASVQQYGKDAQLDASGTATGGTALPAINLGYQESDEVGFTQTSFPLDLGWDGAQVYAQGDYNGDGLSDFLLADTRSYICIGGTRDGYTCNVPDDADCLGGGGFCIQGIGIDNPNTRTYVYLSDGDGTFTKTHLDLNLSWTGALAQAQGDFNGDGLTDFMLCDTQNDRMVIQHPNSRTYVYLSDGDGTFTKINYSLDLNYDGARVYAQGDFNGDGLSDFLLADTRSYICEGGARDGYTCNVPDDADCFGGGGFCVERMGIDNPNTRTYVYLSDGDGTFTKIDLDLNLGWTGALVQAQGDFNGDGLTDFMLCDTRDDNVGIDNPNDRTHTYLSDGDGTFTKINYSLDLDYDGARVYAQGDFNGDGLSDFLLADTRNDRVGIDSPNTRTSTYLSDGDGTFTKVDYSLNLGWAGARVYAQGDFNGDGLSDFLLADTRNDRVGMASPNTRTHMYLSNGDGTFTKINYSLDLGYEGARVQAQGDFNGDGKADFLLADTRNSMVGIENANTRTYVYLAMGAMPDLLSSIDNVAGGTTTIAYEPSSQYQNTLLPFIVQTVSSITVDDGFGNTSTTSYGYSGGLFDFSSREFRGFEYAGQINPDGTTIETWFYQDEYFKGKNYQVDLWESTTGPLLSRTTLSWDMVYIDPPDNTCAFVRLNDKRTELYDGVTVYTQENYTYDLTNGNLLSTVTSGTDAETVTAANQYQNYGSWLWRLTRVTTTGSTSGKVRETYYGYESGTGNMLSKEFWLQGQANPTINMTYNAYGNQITVTDARGNTTTTNYDLTYTYPVKTTYPQTGGVSHIVENEQYDYRFGKVTRTKDENGNRTDYTYDEFGRLEQVDHPDGGQATSEYYDHVFPRYVVTRVKEDGSNTIDKYEYFDGLRRPIQTITFGESNKSIVTKMYYDEMGRNDLAEGPFFSTGVGYPKAPPSEYPWVQTTYDYRGRTLTVTSPNIEYNTVTTNFSYSGLSTTTTDADGGKKTEKKDYLGRVIMVTEYGDGGQLFHTYYSYKASGDLLSVTDHNNNVTSMTYDTLGRKIDMDDPDMGYWQYTYDANGNLKTQIDAKGQTITFNYDALNRMTLKSYSTSDPTVTYSYDSLSIPNGRGRLYSMTNADVTTTANAYDEMGRTKSVSKTTSGNPTTYTTQYDYDLSGKPTQITYPDGYAVFYAYNPGTGLLDTVTGSDFRVFGVYMSYEPTGKIGQLDHGNGTETIYTYDPWSTRLYEIVTTDSSLNDIQRKTYTYTATGNIKTIIDNSTSTIDTDALFEYSYNTNQPHAVKTITVNGTPYTYNYDANGNMTSGPDVTDPAQVATRTITYNADNKPKHIVYTKGGSTVVADYLYDGKGTRAKKVVQGSSTTYYVGEHFEIQDGIATKYVFAGNMRLAVITGSEPYWFHKDHLGSSTALTNENGLVVEKTEYLPFGGLKSHTGSEVTNYKYTDQELDPETGLYFYGARYYDPAIGRFISADTFVQNPHDPQTLNRYSYARNNPLIYVDPSGYSWLSKGLDAVGDAFSDAADAVGDFFGDAADIVGDVLEGAWGAITTTIEGIISGDIQTIATVVVSAVAFWGAGELIGFLNTPTLESFYVVTGTTAAQNAAIHAVAGAVAGGINSAITDSDVGLGMMTGGLSGGIAKFAGGSLPQGFGYQLAGRSAIGGVTGGVTAELYGGSFEKGFKTGMGMGAAGYLFNELGPGHGKRAADASTIGPTGYGTNFLNNAFRQYRSPDLNKLREALAPVKPISDFAFTVRDIKSGTLPMVVFEPQIEALFGLPQQ